MPPNYGQYSFQALADPQPRKLSVIKWNKIK